MKILLLITVQLCLLLSSNAQQIVFSKNTSIDIQQDDFAIVGKLNNEIVAYKKHDQKHEIAYFDNQMKVTRTLELNNIQPNAENVQLFIMNDTIVYFHQIVEFKSIHLYATNVVANQIINTVLIDSSSIKKPKYIPYYKVEISENKQQLLIYNAINIDNTLDIRSNVLNSSLQGKEILYQSFLNTNDIVYNASITNKGTIYIITSDSKYNKSNHDNVSILTKTSNEKEYIPTSVAFKNYAISNIFTFINNTTDELGITAFYKDSKYSIPRGLALVAYNAKLHEATNQVYTPIALQGTKSRFDLRDLIIRNVNIKKDGGLEIVTEKSYQNIINTSRSSISASPNSMMMQEPARIVHEFHNNEVAIFNLKPDGTLLWNQTILKQQISVDDDGIFSSYGMLKYKLGNAYLFNDEVQRSSRLMISFVNNKGDVILKEVQQPLNETPKMFLPRSAIQLSNTEIAFPCISNGALCFAKIKF
jgi:hypothetical protein